MKLWSRGLGRTEITMDFRYYQVIRGRGDAGVIIIGNMQEPVTWEFTMKMEPDDVAGVLKLLFNFSFLWFVIKNLIRYPIYLLNRKKFSVEGTDTLEEKVMSTYQRMTSKQPRRAHGQKASRDGELTDTEPVAA